MQRVRKLPTYQVPRTILMTWIETKKRVRFSLSMEALQPFLSTPSVMHSGPHRNLSRLLRIEFGGYSPLPHHCLSFILSLLPIPYWRTLKEFFYMYTFEGIA